MAISTFTTTKDSKIQGLPDWAKHIHYGAAPTIRCVVLYTGEDKSSWERAIMEFDISTLDGENLTDAKLTLPVTNATNDGEVVFVVRITRPGDWSESLADWVHYEHTTGTWTDEGGDFDDNTGIAFEIPASTGDLELTDSEVLTLCNDALDNRSGILSLIAYLADEDPAVDTALTWTAATTKLEITYGGADSLVERSYSRGVGRGVGRGVA
jgi:hypothetical protein